MVRLGLVNGANAETWDFMPELGGCLSSPHKLSTFAPRRSASWIFRERLTRYQLKRDLRQFLGQNDAVFFDWATDLCARASWQPKSCVLVVRLHRYELYRWANEINWNAVDGIIFVSEAKRRAFVARFPTHACKTHVVPESVSMARFPFASKPFSGSLGTLCLLTPRKRVYDLILGLSELVRTRPSMHLYIAGAPHPAQVDYDEALRRLVSRLGIESNVTFDGPVSRPWEWYPKIDIFVSHSYSEGLQVAPMEAMATGCYTLSHEWAGAEELVPPDCLYLTNNDLVCKVEAFAGLSSAEKDAQRMRMRTHAAGLFDAAKVNARIAEVIEGCLGRAKSSREAARGGEGAREPSPQVDG